MPPALPGRRAQLNYLSREGGVEIQRSEAFFGIGMEAEEIENVISTWNMPVGQGGGPGPGFHASGTVDGTCRLDGRRGSDRDACPNSNGSVPVLRSAVAARAQPIPSTAP